MFSQEFEEKLGELSNEQDALKNSIALNKILHSLLIQSKKDKMMLFWIIIILILSMTLEGFGMLVYGSQFEQVTEGTETTLTYSEASGENSAINNVQGDQYNDQATNAKGG